MRASTFRLHLPLHRGKNRWFTAEGVGNDNFYSSSYFVALATRRSPFMEVRDAVRMDL